ncbi:MAG: UDP-N-acetylmuramate dehydrogenase [Clostridium sp.]|nr:UDP-N-acetylmuramate dehydrogenase [Clostridium sp.]
MKEWMEELLKAAGNSAVLEDEPMSGHISFRVGGPADALVEAADEETVGNVLALCREKGIPCYVLGNGTNVLVKDEGYRGVILKIGREMGHISVTEEEDGSFVIRAGAGALLSAIASRALEQSLTGMEFAAGIPGSLGGAVVMNAGAYGGEMKDILRSVRLLTPEGEIITRTPEDLRMGYRYSIVPKMGYTVLSAEIRLQKGDPAEIKAKMDDLAKQRRDKQPLEYPSAGSTFKRPAGHFAGKLIQDAGLRGYTVGGAQVSEKHCGFVVNRGGASASEILQVMADVQRLVEKTSGVLLEPEVRVL